MASEVSGPVYKVVNKAEKLTRRRHQFGDVFVCPAPVSSRQVPPPALNFEEAKRQLDIVNEEICCFNPTLNPNGQLNPRIFDDDERLSVTEQLARAARKLRKYSVEEELLPEDPSKELSSTISNKKKSKKPNREKSEPVKSKPKFKCTTAEPTEDEEPINNDDLMCFREESFPSNEISKKSKEKKKKRKRRKLREKKSLIITLQEEIGEYIKSKPKKRDNFSMTESYIGQYDSLYRDQIDQEQSQEEEEAKIYTGKVNPLLKKIMKDLAEEGYISASYEQIIFHPDIQQLVKHLQGEFVDKETREWLWLMTKKHWKVISSVDFYSVNPPSMNLSMREFYKSTWAEKAKFQKRAKAKKDVFYFNVAKMRAQAARDLYATLYQKYLGISSAYLNTFYSYQVSKFEDIIVQGLGL